MGTKTSKSDRRDQSALTSRGGGGKAGTAKAGTGKPGAGRKAGAGKKGRKSIAPVKVGKDRNWGPIAMFVAVGVIAVGIIGYAFWAQRDSGSVGWEEAAGEIPGIVNYRETQPDMLTNGHVQGPQTYEVLPPVGGDHNPAWQNCLGDVYTEPIANEHAVHSLEHGAVWITYNPDQLSADQVESLAGLVRGNEKLFMSPFPELDSPISLQAWGYQLKVDDPGDSRISDFIRALRTNASLEGPAARCDGITATGTTPQNVGDQMGG